MRKERRSHQHWKVFPGLKITGDSLQRAPSIYRHNQVVLNLDQVVLNLDQCLQYKALQRIEIIETYRRYIFIIRKVSFSRNVSVIIFCIIEKMCSVIFIFYDILFQNVQFTRIWVSSFNVNICFFFLKQPELYLQVTHVLNY